MQTEEEVFEISYEIYCKTGQFAFELNKKEIEIIKHSSFATIYAEKVLKTRWVEAEPFILNYRKNGEINRNDLYRLLDYYANFFNDTWPELEKTILEDCAAQNPDAEDVIVAYSLVLKEKGLPRWQQGEAVVAKNAKSATQYATSVLESRFEAAEEEIKKDIEQACYYAVNILKTRWPEIEEELAGSGSIAIDYYRAFFKNQRWVELENKIIKNVNLCMDYLRINRMRWPALEKRLLDLRSPKKIITYFSLVGKIGEELHNKMILLSYDTKYKRDVDGYFELIKSKKIKHKKFLKNVRKWLEEHKEKSVNDVLDFIESEEYNPVDVQKN